MADAGSQHEATTRAGSTDASPRPRRWVVGVAAAVVAVLLVGLVALTRHRDGAGPTTIPVGPSTSAVLPSTTVPVPTTVTPTSVTPASAPTADPIGLADWPTRRTVPPTLDDVPLLLPSLPVPGVAATPERSEWVDDGSGLHDHVQTWFDADRDASLTVTTNLDQIAMAPSTSRTPVDTTGWSAPWTEAFFVASAGEYVNLQLVAAEGHVNIGGRRVTEDEAIAIARALTRRPVPQPGWDVPGLPAGFSAFAESAAPPGAGRFLLWIAGDGSPVGELSVATERADVVTAGWSEQAEIDTIDLGGRSAVVALDGGRVAISWTTAGGVEALFGLMGTRSEAEEIVRSITPVDAATWAAATRPADTTDDGCRSLFC